MQTLTISRTGGRSNYTLSPTRNTGELQDKLAKCNGKSRKSAIRDTRTKGNFPKFEAGMSTADYVKMFEAWGTPCKPVEWEQLNEEPCTLYSGADTCETLPAEFESWEDYDAAQCSAAPESTQSAANDDAAPTVPDPEPAAPGAIVAAEVDQVSAVNIDRAMIERFGVSDPAACSHIPGAAAEIARIEAAEIVAVFYRDFANCNDGAAPGVDAILQRARHLRGTAAGFADLPDPDRGAPYAEAARILESDAQSKPAAQSEPERIADVMRARVANTAEALREAAEEIEDRATRVPATRAAEYCAAAAMLRSDAEAAPAVRQSREAFDAATKAAAETLLRLTMGEAHDSARSALIERGRYGAIGARGAIVDELKRLSAAKHWHGWREAQKALYTLGAAESAPVAAPIETAPAEVAPPGYAIEDAAPVDPLPTQSDSVPVPGKLDAAPERIEPDIFIRRATSAERMGNAPRQRAMRSLVPMAGHTVMFKPYGHKGAGFYWVLDRRADTLPSESDNAAPRRLTPQEDRTFATDEADERAASPIPFDWIPAPLDGLDVAELDDLAEFERAGGEVKPTAPAYRDDALCAAPTPSLRIPAGDPRARIPARFARVYLLQA